MYKIEIFLPDTDNPQTSDFASIEEANRHIQNSPLATKVRFTLREGSETIRAVFNPRMVDLPTYVSKVRQKAVLGASSRPKGKAVRFKQVCELTA